MSDEQPSEEPAYREVGFSDIFKNFVLMGWTAFGGPAAHVGLFQKVFVEQLKWMSPEVFTELFAVCQCMPGPSSTQMSFVLGTTKKGIRGGLLSGILFQYPGAFIMTALGLTANLWASDDVVNENAWLAGLVGGLAAAGVALVASAALGLWNKACGAADAKIIAGCSAIILLYFSAELIVPTEMDGRRWMWIFPVLILNGGLCTFFWRGPLEEDSAEIKDSGVEHLGLGPTLGTVLVVLVILVFVLSFALTAVLDYEGNEYLHWFAAFCRTGTVIWGGGQVVLPLLENEMVPTGWVDKSTFFAGLALAQAMPGPLFNFAAFLGAAAGYKAFEDLGAAIAAAAVCWLGLFGPGVTLIFGILPHWGRFRSNSTYKRALPGLNAAAVGLLVAALVQMAAAVRETGTKPEGASPREASTCIGLLAFWGVHWLKLPKPALSQIQAPLVITAAGLLGIVSGVLQMK
mmetsp:Transcript_91889/g.163588  ORF Transcript_91889/g.163588 Transcript_91889/m.163588 type:complete len:460 (+) Transcript_91889:47-1426(+)|eukprot:CAMPEP_0197665382 /NCGR_PEP_ID=MMETSP1338-20131121/59191_1 /TAXON_ID=43686 ORGANISM="Pelagodinium beii, Strain RCC1491" /NCGR_SAMPLE_ID=MMETSP1338 /ASSEMBLY_ACC=CAM_ASM_000754 /LENGTH=459 /DNA_ID=CAMNT_0043244175 /DNA_START=47 /DNA_END=1426 /DNA_ORIENTATION=-